LLKDPSPAALAHAQRCARHRRRALASELDALRDAQVLDNPEAAFKPIIAEPTYRVAGEAPVYA